MVPKQELGNQKRTGCFVGADPGVRPKIGPTHGSAPTPPGPAPGLDSISLSGGGPEWGEL